MEGSSQRDLPHPPGYPPHQKYMVVAYQTLEYDASVGNVRRADGTRFTATEKEARNLLPADARQLPFEPEYQFLELWKAGSA